MVTDIKLLPSGEWKVFTENGEIICEHVVNAAGSFCPEVGEMVGLKNIPSINMIHHYLVTDEHPEIKKLDKLPIILCEPGRAMVAESGSTIVRVNLRKKQKLHINDGTYGTLFDAGVPNIVYPSRLITNGRVISKKLTSFDFYGPTCDSLDYMKGPFILPNNIKENDYIELGQLGAYGLTFRTEFNGFYSDEIYEVEDNPIMTMYNKEATKEFLVA